MYILVSRFLKHSDKMAVALRMGDAARRIQVPSAKKSAVEDISFIGSNGQNLYLFLAEGMASMLNLRINLKFRRPEPKIPN